MTRHCINGRDAARIGNARQRRSLPILMLVALMLLPPVAAQAGEMPEPQSGSLLLRMADGYRVATRINTTVDMTISGTVARVNVSQVFRNDGSDWVEGSYVFPLPDDAAVDRMRLVAGDRVIEGEIREKEQAKKEYDAARQAGKRASLVSQQRSNLFTTAVANIAPGETVTVEIGYLQTVVYDSGEFSLRFPTTMTPRYMPGSPLPDRRGSGWSADTNRVPDASLISPPVVATSTDHRLSLTATIDAGVPLERVLSRYHPIAVDDDGERYAVTLTGAHTATDHDVELAWRPAPSEQPRAALFGETVNGHHHLSLLLLPPTEQAPDATVPARDLTFVIDTSGSMHGTSIEQAKRAVALALDALRPQDRFNLIRFNSVTDVLFSGSVPATAEHLSQAQAWVRRLTANGGTEMRPALTAALRETGAGGLRQVVFVTDGAVGNEAGLYELIEEKLGATRLFTVGIGSAPNGWFMRKAAEAGRGRFVTISALHEVKDKMTRLLTRLREPQLTDIELAWPDGSRAESYPARIADLYAGEPVTVRARLAMAPRPGDLLVIRGNGPTGPWAAEVALARADDNEGVAALWARAKIGAALDAGRRGADADTVRDDVIETALAYQLVSRHTSLVAVDRTPVRPPDAGLTREQVASLLPYGQSQRAIFGFPATATPGPALRFAGAVCLLLAMLVFLSRVSALRGPARAAADTPH
ncbi:MAG: marine proteobacterial sortase target protein [Woeseiaceae bacterium]|nr:marine proteobacterial sortase target protein [Woeseiaceae bacterium]